jgi:Flp pilus assembly protein TadD
MIGTAKGQLAPKYKAGPWAFLPVLTVASLALFSSQAFGAPAANDPAATQTRQLLDSANKALKEGNLNLALIQLKNAVRLAPTDGEARAQLGIALLRGGDLAAAERELRQAQNDYGPYELIVPALLHAMLQRNEIKELLTQFPDPQQGTSDKTTADILIARASALQVSGQPKEARAAMDRSLAMRRDADGLVASVRLAEMQDDFALANSQTDEAR